MTTPHQAPPDGAFVVDDGGGEHKYGQGLTDANTAQVMLGSMINASNPAQVLSNISGTLAKLPLELLNLFAPIIGFAGGVFGSIQEAVGAIMGFFQGLAPMLIESFQEWISGTFNMVSGALNQIFEIVTGIVVTPINEAVGMFKDWWNGLNEAFSGITSAIQSTINFLFGGFLRFPVADGGGDKSPMDLWNAARGVSEMSDTSLQIGEWNNAVLGLRNNKSLMEGVDETEEANFTVDSLFSGDTPPEVIEATASFVPVAYWRAREDTKKGFVSWFGRGFTDVTALYIDIYRLNYDDEVEELIHTSPDQIGSFTDDWRYHVYNIADVEDRIDTVAGDVLGVAWRVEGTGTHEIAGKKAGWMPASLTTVPAKWSSQRTGSGDQDFADITYSSEIPWFGIGIVTGDVPPPYSAPRSTSFTDAGAWEYEIPEFANELDVVVIGGGGAGATGNVLTTTHGVGGRAAEWVTETLVRGVDFPVDATTLTGTVGDGGNNSLGSGSPGDLSRRDAITDGKAAIESAGGAGGSGYNNASAFGESVEDLVYNGTTYAGGVGGASVSAQNGHPGGSPGAGGGGGAGGTYGIAWTGGKGGRGSVYITARQS